MNQGHYSELGSVRGIAALAVCISHTTLVYPLASGFHPVFDTLVNSHGAVVLFFVLSGFVLGLSWQRFGTGIGALVRFYVRRGFRILPTLWVATAIAVLVLAAMPPDPAAPFTGWFHYYNHPLTLQQTVLGFMAMNYSALPPAWTLYIELVGSLAIPGLVWLLSRGRWATIATITALAVISILASKMDTVFLPLVFMVEFACGVAVAINPLRLTRVQSLAAVWLGLALLTIGRPLFFLVLTGSWQSGEYSFNSGGAAMVEGIGGTLFVAGLVAVKVRSRLLDWRPLQLLGDWSYSFYLIHYALMRLIANSLPPLPPVTGTLILAPGTIAISLLASWAMYRWIELPSIRFGKLATARRAMATPAFA